MREIKFRAYDIEHKQMCSVEDMEWHSSTDWPQEGIAVEGKRPDKGMAVLFPNEFILMQYTGLLDKNGVEIYEGDIIKQMWGGKIRPMLIRWFKENSSYWICHMNGDGWSQLYEYKSKEIEVIGNIHESPELLEAKA